MKDVLIRSIPHTGTHFLMHLIESHGMTPRTKHVNGWEGEECICPIRDPYETYCSWATRERQQDFTQQWLFLNEIYTQNKGIFLPIDTEDRDKYLDRLSDHLKVKLTTDWKPQNSLEGDKLRPKVDLSTVYDLPIVRGFGYEY